MSSSLFSEQDAQTAQALSEDYRKIEESGLFDSEYYTRMYPEVLDRGCDPLEHYLTEGVVKGYNPNPLFQTSDYLSENSDVASSGINPFIHYIKFGAKAPYRRASQFFDTRLYIENHPEVVDLDICPMRHFKENHGFEGVQMATLLGSNYLSLDADYGLDRLTAFPSKIAIVIHLFYPDIWMELKRLLKQIDLDFDLFITSPKFVYSRVLSDVVRSFPKASVSLVENRGRDILPFIKLLQTGALNSYDFVCKLHTKRSPHRQDGKMWRERLYESLIGNSAQVSSIIDYFNLHPAVGVIGPADQLIRSGNLYYHGSNRETVERIKVQLGLNPSDLELPFFAGSMFWFRPKTFTPLLDLQIGEPDFAPEAGQMDGTMAHALERMPAIFAKTVGLDYADTSDVEKEASKRNEKFNTTVGAKDFKLIAFYLPQFHPIPENDEWWGKGFTEWTNVTKAKPLYKGHFQPKLPADLGFYDLRIPEVREAQAQLASAYGIHGFCYYYYWFDGRKVLDRPLREVLRSGEPDLPFCICWANENWTRRWDGMDNEILLRQSYSPGFAEQFINDVIPILQDPRYIKLGGKPVLLIYRIKLIPDIEEVINTWRNRCRQVGLGEIHLCAVRFRDINEDVCQYGFDSVVDFPPFHEEIKDISDSIEDLHPEFDGLIYDYQTLVESNIQKYSQGYESNLHRGLMMGWDNTARRKKGVFIAHGASPELYKKWLKAIIQQEIQHNPASESLVFINAWNEWAEGTTLEPDIRFGHGFLQATQTAIAESQQAYPPSTSDPETSP